MLNARNALIVLALLLPASASAQDAQATLAQNVVDLAVAPGIDSRLGRMVNDVVAKQPADQQAALRTKLSGAATEVRGNLLKIFTDYYAKAYTAAELQDLKSFFEGPLGKKFVRVENDKPADVNAQIEQQFMKMIMLLPK